MSRFWKRIHAPVDAATASPRMDIISTRGRLCLSCLYCMKRNSARWGHRCMNHSICNASIRLINWCSIMALNCRSHPICSLCGSSWKEWSQEAHGRWRISEARLGPHAPQSLSGAQQPTSHRADAGSGDERPGATIAPSFACRMMSLSSTGAESPLGPFNQRVAGSIPARPTNRRSLQLPCTQNCSVVSR